MTLVQVTYMIKSHEDAYWPDNLSLFTVNCEHYREPKKQNYGEIWPLWCISKLGESCRTIFVLQGVQENCKKRLFMKPLIAKKITRRTIGAKGFNLLQERLRCKRRQIYMGVLNPTYLPRCLTNFQDFFQLFQFF